MGKKILINRVESFVNGTTIKYLNKLTDKEWDNLSCIPLICKVYLRHLLSQSFKYKSKQQLLENDFNWGIKMDWNNYQIKQKIDSMLSIGFKYDDCCEAIIVTENKSLNAAINYGLLDDDVKKKEYERIKKKLNRMKIRRLKDEDYTKYIKTFKKKEIEEKHNSEEDELVKKWTKKLQKINKNKNISNKTNEILMEIE